MAYGMDPNCTALFPWGVNLARFRPVEDAVAASGRPIGAQTGSGQKRPENTLFVLFCSRNWEPIYGIDVLARAFVKVAQQRPDIGLLLLGSGSEAAAIRRILVAGHVLERVQFPGQVSQSDLPRWYQMADLYISASHVDGSSVSLMEALACGLPVAAFATGALPELVMGDSGRLASYGGDPWKLEPPDLPSLAEAAVEILADPARFRPAARRRAEEAFGLDGMVDAYVQVLLG